MANEDFLIKGGIDLSSIKNDLKKFEREMTERQGAAAGRLGANETLPVAPPEVTRAIDAGVTRSGDRAAIEQEAKVLGRLVALKAREIELTELKAGANARAARSKASAFTEAAQTTIVTQARATGKYPQLIQSLESVLKAEVGLAMKSFRGIGDSAADFKKRADRIIGQADLLTAKAKPAVVENLSRTQVYARNISDNTPRTRSVAPIEQDVLRAYRNASLEFKKNQIAIAAAQVEVRKAYLKLAGNIATRGDSQRPDTAGSPLDVDMLLELGPKADNARPNPEVRQKLQVLNDLYAKQDALYQSLAASGVPEGLSRRKSDPFITGNESLPVLVKFARTADLEAVEQLKALLSRKNIITIGLAETPISAAKSIELAKQAQEDQRRARGPLELNAGPKRLELNPGPPVPVKLTRPLDIAAPKPEATKATTPEEYRAELEAREKKREQKLISADVQPSLATS